MDEALVEMMLADLQAQNTGIDLFSNEYFFDERYAEHRNEIVMLGGPLSHRSRLSILIREGMTDVRRAKIFVGKYQLGNMETIPDALCTYERLVDELYRNEEKSISANDAFETIKEKIQTITGRKMKDHYKTNKSTTFKVISTLHLMSKREKRFFQLLASPRFLEKFSMSFRDAYPYEKNQEQVWFIADLKAYLSAELSDDRFDEIAFAYEELRQWKNEVVQGLQHSLFQAHAHGYQSMVMAYSSLAKVVRNFRFESELNKAPLDEVFFTYLHGLEDMHFYAGYPQLVKIAIPLFSVTPVWKELRKLANTLPASGSDGPKETDKLIQIGDVPALLNHWQGEILAVMQTAMGNRLEPKKYGQIIEGACNLLLTASQFAGSGENLGQEHSALVSLLQIVAAMCCVSYSQDQRTNFEPYWHGQGTQGGSINTSNSPSLPFNISSIIPTVDTIPEEHRHIWVYRLEWFLNALCGQQELCDQKFAFRSAMTTLMMNICKTNNPDRFDQIQRDFEGYLGESLMKST